MTKATTQKSDPGAKPNTIKKRLLAVVLLVGILGGAGYWFALRPTGEEEPIPGEVVSLEPIQVNLAGGHYLKVGIALQLNAETTEEVEGSRALDALITSFSGRSLEALSTVEQRDTIRKRLRAEVVDKYDGVVMDVYFTNFVTQ